MAGRRTDPSPQVSVVVPVFNNEDHLGALLDGLGRQTLRQSWELVVADNGSTDGSVALAESHRAALPCLRVIPTHERGAACARNAGIEAARGEAIVLLDADDVPAPDYLERIAEALGVHDLVCGRLDVTTLNPDWTHALRPSPQSDRVSDPWEFLPASYGCAIAMRRSLYDRLGGFDQRFGSCSDLDFCWRAQLSGTPLVFVPAAVLHYRYRTSLRDLFAQGRLYGRNEVKVYKLYEPHGLPRVPVRRSFDRVRALARHRRRLLHRPGRAWWFNQAGFFVGRFEGSLAERTLLLQ